MKRFLLLALMVSACKGSVTPETTAAAASTTAGAETPTTRAAAPVVGCDPDEMLALGGLLQLDEEMARIAQGVGSALGAEIEFGTRSTLIRIRQGIEDNLEVVDRVAQETTDRKLAELARRIGDYYTFSSAVIEDVLDGVESDQENPLSGIPPRAYNQLVHVPVLAWIEDNCGVDLDGG